MTRTAYAKAGVDIVKADKLVDAIGLRVAKSLLGSRHKKNLAKTIGGYASLYKIDAKRMIAASTDGVGTKLKLAFEMGRHDTVGIDLVAMSVNDLLCVGADPLFFLDYFATGRLSLEQAGAVIEGVARGCELADVALVGGETAEMPGFYADGEYDLAGFAVGIVETKDLLPLTKISSGDVLLGFASSGPHSNGFSLIRKLLRVEKNGPDRAWLEQALMPTRIYTEQVRALKEIAGASLKGLAHVTGSGFLNLPRISDKFDYFVEPGPDCEVPAIFKELARRGNLSAADQCTTFNMGVGLVALVSARKASEILAKLKKNQKCPVFKLGRVAPRKKRVAQVVCKLPGVEAVLEY